MGLALRRGTVAIIVAVLSTAVVGEHADAASLATLYDFCSLGAPCKDGSGPQAAVVMDAAGSLYGTTVGGGAYNHGAIYELTPNAARTAWTYTVLHSFCPPGPVCVDEASPYGRLIIDASGNLYGMTPGGGARGGCTVFELSPNAARTVWTLAVLYNFGSQSSDPTNSRAGLVKDSSGGLFGTSYSGGKYGAGTVFQLTPPNGTATAWAEKVIYSYGANDGTTDAVGPVYSEIASSHRFWQ